MILRALRSLRARLLLVAFVALLPLLGYFFYTRGQLREIALDEVERSARHQARMVAGEYEAALRDTRTLLATLARIPEIREADPEECPRILGEIMEERAYRTAIGVIEEDGFARCMTPPPEEPVYFGDRSYVTRAIRSGEPVFSTFQTGRVTGIPVLIVAHPIPDAEGGQGIVLAGGVEFSRVSPVTELDPFPEGTSLTIVDRRGTILFREPGLAPGDPGIGVLLPAAIRDSLPSDRSVVFQGVDVDGERRIFGAAPLAPEGGPVAAHALVGFRPSALMTRLDRVSNAMLLALLLAIAVLLVGSGGVVEFVVLRRLRPILAASQRLAQGDLGARTGIQGARRDEVSRLARTFDRMAESLERRREEAAARARKEIREREIRLEQVAEAADELFWLYDPGDDEILYLSPGYEELFGVSGDRVRNDPASWFESIHPEDRPAVRAGAQARRRGAWEGEYRVVHPSGNVRWIRHRTYPIRNEEGVYRIAGVAEDITERKRLEEVLHHSGKLEAVGRLAGGVAHDFNNVLTAIRGRLQLLLLELDESDPTRAELEQVDRDTERAVTLTRELLAFSRRQPLRPTVIAPGRVIEHTEDLVRQVLGAEIDLEVQVDPSTPTLRVDPKHLARAIVSLASNAREAIPEGGRVRIGADEMRIGDDDVAEGGGEVKPGSYIRLFVEDDGVGMDPETQEHIFEPFFTTRTDGRGRGLGLAGVYGFVKQSGGHIRVRSTPGEGTCFEIFLPPASSGAGEETDEGGGEEETTEEATDPSAPGR